MNFKASHSNVYHRRSFGTPDKQKGVALITALVITGIAVSLATLIMYRQQIQIRLSSNISTLEQNYQYAYGMEDFAGTILKASFEDQPTFDSLNDPWYSETGLVLPIRGGIMSGKLHDLHARINVNSLIRPKTPKETQTPQPATPSTGEGSTQGTTQTPEPVIEYEYIRLATKDRLTRLIRNIDKDQEMGLAENFAVILQDWIDGDQENGNPIEEGIDRDESGNGAETSYYQSIEPAYYSANTEMISPTELRLLKNMKEKFYKDISAEISTLPILLSDNKASITTININTASENVLRSLGFTPDIVSEIVRIRKETPFEKIEDFKENSDIRNQLQTEDNQDENLVDPLDLEVKSDYFLLEGKVEINNTRLFINSILWRNREKNGQVSVIMRDFSNPETIQKASE